MMQLEYASNLDLKQWDELVLKYNGTIFSTAAYIGATAENWSVAWNEDKSGGIVCPFTVRMGIQVLYAPFFHRYCEWIGENPPTWEELIHFLRQHFNVSMYQLRWENSIIEAEKKVHQVLGSGKKRLNQQAKRALKQVTDYHVSIGAYSENLKELIRDELAGRIHGIDEGTLNILEKLCHGLGNQLIQLNLSQNDNWLGGLWLVRYNGCLLYLKGTVTSDAKNAGGMYHLMNAAIDLAEKEDLIFDFGGSNAKGVQRFNLNWGSEHQTYYQITWNHAPVWWKFIRSLKKIIS